MFGDEEFDAIESKAIAVENQHAMAIAAIRTEIRSDKVVNILVDLLKES